MIMLPFYTLYQNIFKIVLIKLSKARNKLKEIYQLRILPLILSTNCSKNLFQTFILYQIRSKVSGLYYQVQDSFRGEIFEMLHIEELDWELVYLIIGCVELF